MVQCMQGIKKNDNDNATTKKEKRDTVKFHVIWQ